MWNSIPGPQDHALEPKTDTQPLSHSGTLTIFIKILTMTTPLRVHIED